jgi:siderophore synthetase component
LNHWEISDVTRDDDRPIDALEFVNEFHEQLGIGADMLPVYLEEISSTLSSAAYKLSKPDLTAADLVTADFQTIEAAMTEGHPCFVANNSRLGFGMSAYRAYAPETGEAVRLTWIATRKVRTTISHSSSLDYDELLRSELGDEVLRRFAAQIVAVGAAEHGFSVLREIAAAGYHNSYYEAATDKTSPYRKMLSALWRETCTRTNWPSCRMART